MKTLQEQYNLIKEGKGHKGVFLKEAKNKFPNMINKAATYDQATHILKKRSVISENYMDLKPINTIEPTPKAGWEEKANGEQVVRCSGKDWEQVMEPEKIGSKSETIYLSHGMG